MTREGGWATYELLTGAGLVPATNAASSRSWAAAGSTVGSLDDHLVTNAADPWGQRYAVNVAAMKSPVSDTVALSAGPSGIVESAFERDGLPTVGDDIVAMVSSGGLSR